MANSIARFLGLLFVVLIISGLQALFVNWVISFFVDWPITWSNWGVTWAAIIAIRIVLPSRK